MSENRLAGLGPLAIRLWKTRKRGSLLPDPHWRFFIIRLSTAKNSLFDDLKIFELSFQSRATFHRWPFRSLRLAEKFWATFSLIAAFSETWKRATSMRSFPSPELPGKGNTLGLRCIWPFYGPAARRCHFNEPPHYSDFVPTHIRDNDVLQK